MSIARSQQRLRIRESHMIQEGSQQNTIPVENVPREGRNAPARRQGGRRRRVAQMFGGSSSNVAQPIKREVSIAYMQTPPMVHTTVSSPTPFTVSATDVIEASQPMPSVITIPFTLIGLETIESSDPIDAEHVNGLP